MWDLVDYYDNRSELHYGINVIGRAVYFWEKLVRFLMSTLCQLKKEMKVELNCTEY